MDSRFTFHTSASSNRKHWRPHCYYGVKIVRGSIISSSSKESQLQCRRNASTTFSWWFFFNLLWFPFTKNGSITKTSLVLQCSIQIHLIKKNSCFSDIHHTLKNYTVHKLCRDIANDYCKMVHSCKITFYQMIICAT